MKRTCLSLFIVAGLAALIPGCSSGPRLRPDTVAIIDVQSEKKSDSEFTSYKVRVGYTLRSTERGEIKLGFDLEEPERFIILGQQKVAKGTGEVEMLAEVRLPKRSIVTVFADLSEEDHPTEWTSLAKASRVIPLGE
jgi:hypothetical protein